MFILSVTFLSSHSEIGIVLIDFLVLLLGSSIDL